MKEYGRKGTDNHKAKLDEVKVREIRGLLAKNVLQKQIAEKYGITVTVISKIKKGQLWGHVK